MDIFEDDNIPSSDDEDSTIDEDTCKSDELARLFTNGYHLASEECVSLKKSYILHMAPSKTFDRIVASTSSQTVHLYDITSGLKRRDTPKYLKNLESPIVGVKYAKMSSELLLVSTNEGVMLIDERSDGIVHTFIDDRDVPRKKPINCFDINANDRILCAGTEQEANESFLLFFDIRQRSLLGAYWESHQDDITDIKFHSKNPDWVVSGSTDGLICVFDISQTDEDDALLCTVNTESSAGNINWHQNVYEKDLVSCITHTNDLLIYSMEDFDDAELLTSFDREAVTKEMKRKSIIDCTLIDCHDTMEGEILLIAGSNYEKGKCLRSLVYQNRSLVPSTDFIGNKQIVRTSVFDNKTNVLITGGENGLITIWTPGANVDKEVNKLKSSNLKEKTYKKHKKVPY